MASRVRMLTDAYSVGIELVNAVAVGTPLPQAVESVTGPFDRLTDRYAGWHPAPHAFDGPIRLFLYREVTGESYRALAQHPELAERFGLSKIPDESVLSRAWCTRFGDTECEFITTAAHCAVKEISDEKPDVPVVRPKAEVVTPTRDPSAFPADGQASDSEQPPDADEDDGFTTTRSTARPASHATTVSGQSTLAGHGTRRMTTRSFSNYRRSWG